MNEIATMAAPMPALFDAGLYENVFKMAERISKSALVPQAYRNKPEDTAIAMLLALEQGAPPLTSLGSIAVINGKPAWFGDAIPGIAMRKNMIKSMREGFEGEGASLTAWCEIERPNGDLIRHTFSVDDASAAGLWGKAGPWKQYPKRMLQMRARSWAVRDAAPHAFLGPTVEELEGAPDLTPRGPEHAKDITPPKPVAVERRPTSKAGKTAKPEVDLSGSPEVEAAVEAQAPISATVEVIWNDGEVEEFGTAADGARAMYGAMRSMSFDECMALTGKNPWLISAGKKACDAIDAMISSKQEAA